MLLAPLNKLSNFEFEFMKINKTYIYVTISTVALIIVLAIQVNWIINSARLKEDLFNEKANMVLSKTATDLALDTVTCKQIESCIGRNEIHKTDSLLNHNMNVYHLSLDYNFSVKSANNTTGSALEGNVYKKKLEEEATKNGLVLNLFLPGKTQFIMAEMGTMFITSIILILAVLLLFWRTIRSLMWEKRISDNTNTFLNNITHEFKTPLTNIALAGNMIMRESQNGNNDKIRQYSQIILDENSKLNQQVDMVLNLTVLEDGNIPLVLNHVDIHSILSKSINCFQMPFEAINAITEIKLNAQNHHIIGDANLLENAFCNLIDNAIKYRNDSFRLNITTYNEAEDLIIEFKDNGIGIDKKYQNMVFDKFFRVPTGNLHSVKGFGIGLAYLKQIITQHHGKITLESELNAGTTFIIKLPLAKH
jgi:two-component system phosphate regulon sensor histidine kinase PhoR